MKWMMLTALVLLTGCSVLDLEPTTVVTVPEVHTTLPDSCEPAYPDFCVPANAANLDCDKVGYEFTVIGDDPYGFDANGNGIACERDEDLVLDN